MTSVVAAPEPPLGSKENPHPFKWGQGKNKNPGEHYRDSKGNIRIALGSGRLKPNSSKESIEKAKKYKKELYDNNAEYREKMKERKKKWADVNKERNHKNNLASAKRRREGSIIGRFKNILHGAKSRKWTKNQEPEKRKKEYNIDLDYLLELWEKCNGICFRFKKKMTTLDNDLWLVSIDRIDSKKGYMKGNVQLVSSLYNQMKMNRTEEEMDKVFDQLKLVYSNTSSSKLL